MRILSILFSLGFLVVLFTTGSQFASCTKEVTIRDTVTIIETDTVTVKDTVTIIDSSCASCYDLKNGLIAYYNFNGGNLNDSSGMNNHISFNNAVKTTDRFGRTDNAYLFNGTSSYMSVPNSNTLNPTEISIMAVFKPNGFYTGRCHGNSLVTKGWPREVAGHYTLGFNDSSATRCEPGQPVNVNTEVVNAAVQSAGVQADSVFLQPGEWYNVLYTYDGTVSTVYINGKLIKTEPVTQVNAGNTFEVMIGRTGNPNYEYWLNGAVDEIRIYERALCEGEAKALYHLKN